MSALFSVTDLDNADYGRGVKDGALAFGYRRY